MNPTRVWAKNFRTYETVEWDIPQGLTAIVGHNTVTDGSDSNGSGKSSLLELLPISLFGPPMPWSEYLTAGGEAESCEVGCELEHAGERYRIRRTFSAKGRGSSKLDFERLDLTEADLDVWDYVPLTRGTQQDTQDAILQTLHLSESVFSHSVYAAQGARHFADPSLPPRERKQIMAEALGLDAWDAKLELVRADLSETKGEIAGIGVRLGTFADDIATLPALYEAHSELVESARGAADLLQTSEATASDVSAQYTAHREANARHAGLMSAVAAAQATEAALRERLQTASDAAEVLGGMGLQLAELTLKAASAEQLQADVARQEHAQEMRAQALREQATLTSGQATLREQARSLMGEEAEHSTKAAAIRVEITRLSAEGSGVCAHCQQPVRGPALEATVASMSRDVDALEARAAELRAAIEGTVAEGMAVTAQLADLAVPGETIGDLVPAMRLAEARQAERELAALQERKRHLEEVAATFTPGLEAEHESAVTAVADAVAAAHSAEPKQSEIEWHAMGAEAVKQVGLAKIVDGDARAALAKSEEKIRNLEELAGRSEEALLAKGLLEGRLDHLKWMETAYGRNGVPVMLMESFGVAPLEREAARILQQLGTSFRLELVTQREKKTGGLADTMEVIAHGPNGALRFESYSGGEQQRLAFALKIAFARLVASQRGSEIGVLFIDEMPFLDAAGMAAVAEVLRGLSEFRSIVLVSHDERLVDAFDSVVTIVRDESGSRLEAA